MARYAVVNQECKVIQVIEWDGVAEWRCPDECFLFPSDKVDCGDFFDKSTNVLTKNDGLSYVLTF